MFGILCSSPEGMFDHTRVVYTEPSRGTRLCPSAGCSCISHTPLPMWFLMGEPHPPPHKPTDKILKQVNLQHEKGGQIINPYTVYRLTLSGRQDVSVQPQSLVLEVVMKPAAQDWVKFWQLHTHSSTSQHFVFFIDSRRCAGQSGRAWREHSSFLQTVVGKNNVNDITSVYSLSLSVSLHVDNLNITEKDRLDVIPHSWIGWHSPGFFRTTVWPSSQKGTSGGSQFTRSHAKRSHECWLKN